MWWSPGTDPAARQRLNQRMTPKMWTRMTLGDVAAHFSALDYDIAHTRGLTNANRAALRDKALKQRRFFAGRAPAADAGWKEAAVHWDSPTGYNPVMNIQAQAEAATAKKAKDLLLARVRRRQSRSPRIGAGWF